MAASISYQSGVTRGSASGNFTLSFTAASAAGQERLLALTSVSNGNPTGLTFSSVVIDGQAATAVGSHVRAADNGGNGVVAAFFRAPGTSGTSFNVAVNISMAVFDVRAHLWTLNNTGTFLASNTASFGETASNLSLNLNTVANGVAAAVMLAHNSPTHATTWVGLTERFDGQTLYTGDWVSAADLNVSSTSTPLTVTAQVPGDFTTGNAGVGVSVSFNSATGGQQLINIGAVEDDGTGDHLRVAFDKTNQNFTELYTADTTFLKTATAATTYQPLDADLTAIAALSGTNTIYYRSAASTWSGVTIGTGLTFTSGTLAAGGGTAVTVAVQKFTASGTYTPTSGMRYCTIECVGGGGGGGGVGNATSAVIGAGGGGSGGYSRVTVAAATVGASQAVTIGAAGTAGSSGGGNGGSGGATSVSTLCVANGGSGGLGQTGGQLAGGAGGNLTSAVGDITAAGTPGTPGVDIIDVNAVTNGGNGGSSFFGGGGRGGVMVAGGGSAVGSAGSNYGAGGGGACNANVATARAGGAGSAGYVIITEYF